MKPLLSESADNQSLQALGRASVQIVHDLKNQINGLKLYATFLRKRMEKTARPEDELETVNKLIAGLDRTAADLSLLIEFGQPISLRKQPLVDLNKIMNGVATAVNDHPPTTGALSGRLIVNSESESLVGDFDSALLSDALRSISVGALKMVNSKTRQGSLEIFLKGEPVGTSDSSTRSGVIEWRVLEAFDHDPFRSFAGSDEIRMSIAAKAIEAHGGSAERRNGVLRVSLPLSESSAAEKT